MSGTAQLGSESPLSIARRSLRRSTEASIARIALPFVLLALLVAGCGGKTTYSIAKTRACLVSRGAEIGGKLDFVASTSTGGAFAVSLGTNSVKVVFGLTEADAQSIFNGYQRLAFQNVRAGLPDVLRRYNNAVTLWREHPQDADLSLIVGCLR